MTRRSLQPASAPSVNNSNRYNGYNSCNPPRPCPLFDVVHPTFHLPTMASPTLQGALKDVLFWRGCHGVWHARTMQDFVSWQLPEEVPVDQQGSGSCSAPSRWSCTSSRRCGEVSLGTWFRKPGSFLFFRVSKQGPCFTATEEDWSNMRFVTI